jgi:predicted AlkP superfamily phosphohydrolase/phosphomutase
LPVRLQAYERMTLFLERTSPQNLLVRINQPGLTARDFHKLLLEEIRSEYNHNASQQIYIGEEVWSTIKNAKEDLIIEINEAAQQVPSDAPSIELAKRIFEVALSKNVDPVGHALSELKKEIQRVF